MAKCKKCGADISENAIACPKCGAWHPVEKAVVAKKDVSPKKPVVPQHESPTKEKQSAVKYYTPYVDRDKNNRRCAFFTLFGFLSFVAYFSAEKFYDKSTDFGITLCIFSIIFALITLAIGIFMFVATDERKAADWFFLWCGILLTIFILIECISFIDFINEFEKLQARYRYR